MKRISAYILGGCLLASTFTACDNVLDVTPDAFVTQDQVTDMEYVANGMYVRAFDVSYYGRDAYVLGDVGTDNLVERRNAGRYLNHYLMNKNRLTGQPVGNMFQQIYRVVLQANLVLEHPKATNEQKGHAYFMRALSYHDLLKFYGPVPLVLKATSEENLFNMPAKATEADINTQVLADLTEAEKLITNKQPNKPTIAAVNALRSRVYLFMKDYAKVVAAADAVKGFSLVSASDHTLYFNTPARSGGPETIFELRKMFNQSLGSDNQGSIYLLPAYGAYTVNPAFVDAHEVNDVRTKVYEQVIPSSPGFYFMHKFKEQEGVAGLHSPKVLRYAEVLLNKAEALVQLGKSAEATAIISQVRASRLQGATETQLTNDGSLATVLAERRKELAFEGHRLFDLRRNNMPSPVYRLAASPKGKDKTVTLVTNAAAGDKQFWLPIPESELLANPNMTSNFGY